MGGGSNRAADAARSDELQRRADVLRAQQTIEGVYASPERANDINSVVAATRQFLDQDLRKQDATARRQLKFATARSGVSGGSYAIDRTKDLGQQYLKGALEVERRAQASGNALRDADQQSKMQLFSLAQNGLDTGNAARQAAESMRVNLANARSQATENGVGDLFKGFADVYSRSRERAGENKAERYQYGSTYSPTVGGGFG